MMKPQLFLLFICTVLLIPTGARSSSVICVVALEGNLQEKLTHEFKNATAVFSGKVIAEEYRPVTEATANEPEGSQLLSYRILVDRWWKGDKREEVVVSTSSIKLPDGSGRFLAEDVRFETGKSYLIYSYGKPEMLRTTVCSLTTLIEQATDQLQILGEGQSPKKKN